MNGTGAIVGSGNLQWRNSSWLEMMPGMASTILLAMMPDMASTISPIRFAFFNDNPCWLRKWLTASLATSGLADRANHKSVFG